MRIQTIVHNKALVCVFYSDEEDLLKSFSEQDGRKDSTSHTMRRISSGGNPLVSVAQQSSAQVYMNGFLVRKVHADSDGKRSKPFLRCSLLFDLVMFSSVLYSLNNCSLNDRRIFLFCFPVKIAKI